VDELIRFDSIRFDSIRPINFFLFTSLGLLMRSSDCKQLSFVGFVVAVAAVVSTRVRVCRAHQVLVRTGFGIDGFSVTRHGFLWPRPFQHGTMVSMLPRSVTFTLDELRNATLSAIDDDGWAADREGSVERESVGVGVGVGATLVVRPKRPCVDMPGFEQYVESMHALSPRQFEQTLFHSLRPDVLRACTDADAGTVGSSIGSAEFRRTAQTKLDVLGVELLLVDSVSHRRLKRPALTLPAQ
jgi:hypothetical protein